MKKTAFDSKVCGHFKEAIQHTWKEMSSTGAYAASSILGANTRKNHGLLVVPNGEEKHRVLLSNIDETVSIAGRIYPLSTRQYEAGPYPKGFEYLENFYLAPFPTWIYRIENLAFMKMLILMKEENTVIIRYQLLSSYGDYVRLEIRPLLAFRRTDQICKRPVFQEPEVKTIGRKIHITQSQTGASVDLFHNAALIDRCPIWFNDVVCSQPQKGTLQVKEDLFSPCALHFAFLKEEGIYFCASTGLKDIKESFFYNPKSLTQTTLKSDFRF